MTGSPEPLVWFFSLPTCICIFKLNRIKAETEEVQEEDLVKAFRKV